MQAGAGLEERHIAVIDQVVIAVALARGVLRRVDLVEARIDAHQLEVDTKLSTTADIVAEPDAEIGISMPQRLAGGIAPHAVIAHRPAGLVQQAHGAAQVAPVVQPVRIRAVRAHRRLGQHLLRHRRVERFQKRELGALGHARRLQMRVLHEGMALLEEAVLQRRVGPFEIEAQRDRLPHALVLQLFAAEVEDEARGRRRQPVGQRLGDDMALIGRRKVIARRPGLGIALGAEGIDPGLERLEGGVVIGEILDPDAVEIVPPHIDRQVPAPVVGIALVDDAAVHLRAFDLIRARSRRRLQPRLVQPRAGLGVPFARKDRRAADLIDQRAARDALGEGEPDRVIVERLRAGDPPPHRLGIGAQPLIEKEVVREHHVMGGDRRAIGEPGLGAHVKDDPGLAPVIFEALGQQPVALVVAVAGQRLAGGLRPAQKALVDHPREPPARPLRE